MKKIFSITLALMLIVSVFVSTQVFAESEYIVKPGDTIGKIAKQYGLDWQKLTEVNKIANPDLIFPGEKIVLSDYTTEDLNEQLVMSIAWVQNSAEYRALVYQAFNVAQMMLDKDLAENTSNEKRAVIVDVDETIIDNSAYEAYLIGNNFGYSSKTWNPWMGAAEATAIPGAVDFLNYAFDKGVDVYYVTNRKVVGKEGTLKNLKALGFPQVDEEHLMIRTGSSSKTERRNAVDADHRIVLLMGDNLNDFSDVYEKKSIEERFAATDANKDLFGTKFIVLPNPEYGEWEGALYNYDWGSSTKEKDQMRKNTLKRWSYEQ